MSVINRSKLILGIIQMFYIYSFIWQSNTFFIAHLFNSYQQVVNNYNLIEVNTI